jgi:2-(1,2-epoxy-1,2-dihydrophenyl)acetyl-CoA isomerase
VSYTALKASVGFGESHTLADTLVFEEEMQAKCGRTDDHREAVDAFLAKRKPDFKGR